MVSPIDGASIKPITNSPEVHNAIRDSKLVVVYVYGLQCPACWRMTPLVESAARSKEFESIMFYKVDGNSDDRDLQDILEEQLYTPGFPCIFVFYLGQVFRFLCGHDPSFKDWLASAVSASERATDGAVVSHPDLLKGNSSTIAEIASLESFQNIKDSTEGPVILYLYSTRSSEHKCFSRIFECGALSSVLEAGLYCILDSDKHTEIVEEIVKEMEIDLVTGVVGFYKGEMYGQRRACQAWGDFGKWLFAFSDAIEIADSASDNEWTAPSSHQIMPITEITSLTQLSKFISDHKNVAINFFMDWPSSRAISLVFERAAADSTLNEIYFAQVDFDEHWEDIALPLKNNENSVPEFEGLHDVYIWTISLFSGGKVVVASCHVATLKKDLFSHISASDNFIDESETNAKSSDELTAGEEDQLEPISASDDFIDASETDAKISDELTPVEIEELPLDALEEVQITDFLEDTFEKLSISGTVSDAGAQKGTESTISLPSSIIANRVTCQGKYQLRHQRPLYQKALNIQPKTFSDHENGCLFTPKSKEQRLQIGLGNEADSRFSIELSCDKLPGGETIICFHINFIVDPTANARYQSAMFEVNFSQIEDDDGHERPLTIRDYEPKDQQGEATEVQVGRAVNNSLGVSGGHSLLSLSTLSSLSTTEQYTKKTASRVRGARASPSTVNWAFKEDEGRAGRNGLAATYTVHACIPSTGLTSIRFWAKAILMRPRRPKVGLRIGSTESPSEKLLDLHVLHIEKA